MMERSEAYHLIEQICDDYGLTIAEREALKMAMHDIEFVDLMPADVAPVVHGEWEMLGDKYANCTNCGTIFEALPTEYVFKANNKFCRNCGADMRERKGDDAD